jgi:hypothetical protein
MTSKQVDCIVTVPICCEASRLPSLLTCLAEQHHPATAIYACVNQPASWHSKPEHMARIENNETCLRLLQEWSKKLPLTIFDQASPGKAWPDKEAGVGKARRMMLDAASDMASEHDILICMDADTHYEPDYISSIVRHFDEHPTHIGLAAPYYHDVSGDQTEQLNMLYYECYMRYTFLNLSAMDSPYAFSALGSVISMRAGAYRAVGGMPERQAGEDFYMLQKLAKHGPLGRDLPSLVRPSSRQSDRVPFGTGQAVRSLCPERYPFFNPDSFDMIHATTQLFSTLYTNPTSTPMDDFFESCFGTRDPWSTLRDNASSCKSFVRACHGRLDGLRILQFLKSRETSSANPANRLHAWLTRIPDTFTLAWSSLTPSMKHILETPPDFQNLQSMTDFREALFALEAKVRQS